MRDPDNTIRCNHIRNIVVYRVRLGKAPINITLAADHQHMAIIRCPFDTRNDREQAVPCRLINFLHPGVCIVVGQGNPCTAKIMRRLNQCGRGKIPIAVHSMRMQLKRTVPYHISFSPFPTTRIL